MLHGTRVESTGNGILPLTNPGDYGKITFDGETEWLVILPDGDTASLGTDSVQENEDRTITYLKDIKTDEWSGILMNGNWLENVVLPIADKPVESKRVGDWMQSFTGKAVWPLDPREEELDIIDIAHALARTCRFNGHLEVFHSVAQHSVQVAGILATQGYSVAIQLAGLMHDSAEAYVGDMIRPMKRMIPDFHLYEDALLVVLSSKFKFSFPFVPAVHLADNMALAAEARDLMKAPPIPWEKLPTPLPETVIPLSPVDAEFLFLETFYRLSTDA